MDENLICALNARSNNNAKFIAGCCNSCSLFWTHICVVVVAAAAKTLKFSSQSPSHVIGSIRSNHPKLTVTLGSSWPKADLQTTLTQTDAPTAAADPSTHGESNNTTHKYMLLTKQIHFQIFYVNWFFKLLKSLQWLMNSIVWLAFFHHNSRTLSKFD